MQSHDTPQKRCSTCGMVKPVTDFTPRADRPGQYLSSCKVCRSAAASFNYVPHPRPIPTVKTCTRCGITLLVEEFPRRGDGEGYRSQCRKCKNLGSQEYKQQKRAEDPEAWYAAEAEYRARMGPEVLKQRGLDWAARHPEQVWGQRFEMKQRRRARESNVGGEILAAHWKALKKFYNYRCLRCKRREPEIALTLDHIKPIVKGGPNTILNAQPLCRPCNAWKFDKTIDFRPAIRMRDLLQLFRDLGVLPKRS